MRLVVLLSVLLLTLPAMATLQGEADPSIDPWIRSASDSDALLAALAIHQEKVPAEFYDRLEYAQPDGSLRVMVALTERDASVEAWLEETAIALHWYGDTANALMLIGPDALAPLLEDTRTAFVEPDYPVDYFMAVATTDVNARSLGGAGTGVWTLDSSGTLQSDITGVSTAYTGKDIRVAVIDSGIDQTHRDFSGEGCTAGIYAPCNSRIVEAILIDHLLPGSTPVGSTLPTTEAASGHGTHVAGSVAGNAYYGRHDGFSSSSHGGDRLAFGVAPEADIISVKNGDSQWAGLATDAIAWVQANAAAYDIKVATNSWGCLGGCSYNSASATSNVVRAAYMQGVLITFAVGNDGGSGGGSEFSGYAQHPYVLGVAAYDDATDRLASFSSRGHAASSNSLPTPTTWTPGSEWPSASNARRPDIAAPGVDIWSARTLTGGTSSLLPRVSGYDVGASGGVSPYALMSGTSMATPVVAGAAAVVFDACPNAAPLDVMRAIMVGADGSGVFKTGSSTVAQPFEVGYGKLDVRASVDWALTQSFC